MKTVFSILALALTPVVMAGNTTPVTIVESTEASSTEAPSKYAWEVAAVYNHALTDINKNYPSPSINTYGLDVTGLYNVKGNHYATLRFSYAFGEECGYELNNFAIMPGYRYVRPVAEKWTAFAGANLGLGISMLDYPGMHGSDYALSSSDDMANIVYSVEVGASYAVTPKLNIVGALMLNGGMSPFGGAAYSDASEEQVSVGVRLGVGGKF